MKRRPKVEDFTDGTRLRPKIEILPHNSCTDARFNGCFVGSSLQVLHGQQLQGLPRGGHAVHGPGCRAGRHADRVVRVRKGRFRVHDDGELAEREQQRHDGLQHVRVLRRPLVRRFHERAHRNVRPDRVPFGLRRHYRHRDRAARPAQGPGDHHGDHHLRAVARPRHSTHTQHVELEQLPVDQRLLHVQQAHRDGGPAENVGGQHGTVQAGRQSRHVRHLQVTAGGHRHRLGAAERANRAVTAHYREYAFARHDRSRNAFPAMPSRPANTKTNILV